MNRTKSQADQILELVLDSDVLLFTDQYGVPHIRFPRGQREIPVVYPLTSGVVKDWLSDLLWSKRQKAPSSQATNAALSVLKSKAREGLKQNLYNRVAPGNNGSILIDVVNEGWNYFKVTSKKWTIDSMGLSPFRRYNHQKQLPIPSNHGDPWKLLQFTNLADKRHRLLFLVSVISYFIPEIQHPVLLFYGPHGSGKSLSMRAARALIDPSIVELLTLPRSDRELVQQLYHHYGAFYDNLTRLPGWASDVFCRAVTGTGNTKRQLYTDSDDIIYTFRRCIGLNGINIAAQQSDLLDRSIILGCEMMDNSQRMEEKELSKKIEETMPSILGGVLDTLVEALNIYPTIKLDKLYRMADFTRWGCAICEALGVEHYLFLEAYEENIRSQSEETLKASLVATVLCNWMELHTERSWKGSPTDLYNELDQYAKDQGISTRQKAWPKAPHWLIRRINEVKPGLYAAGYTIEVTRSKKSRIITIRKSSGNAVNDVTSVTDDSSDSKNSKLGDFS